MEHGSVFLLEEFGGLLFPALCNFHAGPPCQESDDNGVCVAGKVPSVVDDMDVFGVTVRAIVCVAQKPWAKMWMKWKMS